MKCAIYTQAMSFHKEVVLPLLRRGDSEFWHDLAREALHLAEISPLTLQVLRSMCLQHGRFSSERLNITLGGQMYENPVLVGAGWDKAGRSVKALHSLGASGVEVGTVTQYPQAGNPKRRQFALTDAVVLNRLGFNSPGMEAVAQNLQRYADSGIPIGISLGKNKALSAAMAPETYAAVAEKLYPFASYFAVNVSSPNTPGLRELQEKDALTDIVQAVLQTMDQLGERKPLYVKIAPDLTPTQIDDVIEVVLLNRVTGIIATNTTNSDRIKQKYGVAGEMGGISGDDPEYQRMVVDAIGHIYRETKGKVEIIGSGGVKGGASALRLIREGARAVQVVTAIRSQGPGVLSQISYELNSFMEQNGIESVMQLVGANH